MKLKDLWSLFIVIIKRDSNDLTRGKLPAIARFENVFQMLKSVVGHHARFK